MSKTRFISLLLIIFLASIFVQTAASDTPEITIFSPEKNKVYPSKDISLHPSEEISLQFKVEGQPILVGYRLNTEEIKWFVVKDNQFAPVLNKKSFYIPAIGMIHSPEAFNPQFHIYGENRQYLTSIAVTAMSETSLNFTIVEGGIVSKQINRNLTSYPPLKVGEDLQLLDGYITYLLDFYINSSDSKNEFVELAIANESDFKNLSNESVFELELDNITRGKYKLDVFATNYDGNKFWSIVSSVKFSRNSYSLIVYNSIDEPAAMSLFSGLQNFSIVRRFSPEDPYCHDICEKIYREFQFDPILGGAYANDYLFIIGGPNASTIGNASAQYLTEEEREYLINTENAIGYWIKPSNYSNYFNSSYKARIKEKAIRGTVVKFDRQKVIVIAGHTRNETLAAVKLFEKKGIDELFRR